MLRKSPTFTAAAVLTLALGHRRHGRDRDAPRHAVLPALPYADADRIVTLWQRPPTGEREDVAPANFLDWRERSRSFEQARGRDPVFVRLHRRRRTRGVLRRAGHRGILGGARDQAGARTRSSCPRSICAEAVRSRSSRTGSGSGASAVIPAIVNRAISLDGEPMTVVGVLPRGLQSAAAAAARRAVGLDAEDYPGAREADARQRLVERRRTAEAGVSLRRGPGRDDRVASRRSAREYPATNAAARRSKSSPCAST